MTATLPTPVSLASPQLHVCPLACLPLAWQLGLYSPWPPVKEWVWRIVSSHFVLGEVSNGPWKHGSHLSPHWLWRMGTCLHCGSDGPRPLFAGAEWDVQLPKRRAGLLILSHYSWVNSSYIIEYVTLAIKPWVIQIIWTPQSECVLLYTLFPPPIIQLHLHLTLGFVEKFQFYCCCNGNYSLGTEWSVQIKFCVMFLWLLILWNHKYEYTKYQNGPSSVFSIYSSVSAISVEVEKTNAAKKQFILFMFQPSFLSVSQYVSSIAKIKFWLFFLFFFMMKSFIINTTCMRIWPSKPETCFRELDMKLTLFFSQNVYCVFFAFWRMVTDWFLTLHLYSCELSNLGKEAPLAPLIVCAC